MTIIEAARPTGDYRVPLDRAYTLVSPVEIPVVDGRPLWTASEWELAWGDRTWATAEEAEAILHAVVNNPTNDPAFRAAEWRVAHIWVYSTNGMPIGHYVHTEES